MTVKACLRSMRLRTLPLSLSGVVLGIFIAATHGSLSILTVVLLLLTAALLQVLSNLCNELGDVLHGTDTDERQGMHYSIQEGEMTVAQMKRLIAAVAICCAVCGACMVYSSFGTLWDVRPLVLLALGGAAIVAAMRYTLGHNPYGYRGWGDLFVFVFFGLVSVCGGYYVCLHDMTDWLLLLPGSAIGFFSMGVLNVNNIRDMKTDAATRTTVALRLGGRRARVYQTVLIACGWVAMGVYTAVTAEGWTPWLFVLALPLFAKHLLGVWHRDGRDLDPMLPLLVMSTFLFTLLAGAGMLLSAL